MKLTLIFRLLAFLSIGLLFACTIKPKGKNDKEVLSDILNDPRVNTKEVGEREGIKYFPIEENGKMGFRDLNGNVVIEPMFDEAEMFSEGFSSVQIGNKWGLIDETGKYMLQPQFEY